MADLPSVVLTLACAWATLRALDSRRTEEWLFAGLIAGVAVGVKPANAFLLVAVAALLALRRAGSWRDRLCGGHLSRHPRAGAVEAARARRPPFVRGGPGARSGGTDPGGRPTQLRSVESSPLEGGVPCVHGILLERPVARVGRARGRGRSNQARAGERDVSGRVVSHVLRREGVEQSCEHRHDVVLPPVRARAPRVLLARGGDRLSRPSPSPGRRAVCAAPRAAVGGRHDGGARRARATRPRPGAARPAGLWIDRS